MRLKVSIWPLEQDSFIWEIVHFIWEIVHPFEKLFHLTKVYLFASLLKALNPKRHHHSPEWHQSSQNTVTPRASGDTKQLDSPDTPDSQKITWFTCFTRFTKCSRYTCFTRFTKCTRVARYTNFPHLNFSPHAPRSTPHKFQNIKVAKLKTQAALIFPEIFSKKTWKPDQIISFSLWSNKSNHSFS